MWSFYGRDKNQRWRAELASYLCQLERRAEQADGLQQVQEAEARRQGPANGAYALTLGTHRCFPFHVLLLLDQLLSAMASSCAASLHDLFLRLALPDRPQLLTRGASSGGIT